MNKAVEAIELNKKIHEDNGIKIQGGKKYTKVVHRIEAFRRTVGYDYGIDTTVTLGSTGALVKAIITNKDGMVIGSGSSFTKNIQADKGIEKCESTAIGRALASLALGGDEYASIEEIDTHTDRYKEPKIKDKPNVPKPVKQPEPKVVPVNERELGYILGAITSAIDMDALNDAKRNAKSAWSRLDKAQRDSVTDAVAETSKELDG